MNHTSTRRTALLVVAIGAIVAPSLIGATPAPVLAEARVPDDTRQIADQFGWTVDETVDHLAAHDEFGELIGVLSTDFPDSFSGAEFAREPGEESTIRLRGRMSERMSAIVRRSGIDLRVVEHAPYSESQLQHRADEVVRVLADLGYGEVSAAVMADGEISVAVDGAVPALAELPAELRDGVRLVTGPDVIATADANVIGGLKVSSASSQCTAAFTVRSLATEETGIATAAHCGVFLIWTWPVELMAPQKSHFGAFGDVRWLTTTGDEVPKYKAKPGIVRPVTGVRTTFFNNGLTCVYSRMTATRTCDHVFSTYAVVWTGSTFLGGLVATDGDHTVGGDSGGPWSRNTTAHGVHHGSVWIFPSERNVFSRAALLPLTLGVEVLTQ